MSTYLGVDVGSLTTKVVVVGEQGEMLFSYYRRNEGGPIEAIQESFRTIVRQSYRVAAAGVTGSGRQLAAAMIGADVVVNEITAHALAARFVEPAVRTVIDIGGQDSKIIFLKRGVCTGFNMNTVCAAGTGSFLDHQALRLGIPIEQFGDYALQAENPVAIAGRCGVFAESDLIHKQQMGYRIENLVAGLCLALAKNYVTNVARNKKVETPALFQGGVAANSGIKWSLEKVLGLELQVPEHYRTMGALGAALLALKQKREGLVKSTAFHGTATVAQSAYNPRGFICNKCANNCEISELYIGEKLAGRWGSRCGRWEESLDLVSAGTANKTLNSR